MICILAPAAYAKQTPLQTPKNFKAHYQASLSGIEVKATRALATREDGSRELRFKAKSWLAKINEFSIFEWNPQGDLIPNRYEYHRSGLGRDRHAVLTFDWAKQRVTNDVQKKPWQMDIPEGALDKLSYQLQLRQQLINGLPLTEYAIADGGRLKTYRFERLGDEVIDTPVGKLNTVKVRRIRTSDKGRQTLIWLARDWDYLLVKLSQTESDGKHYEINLSSADLDGLRVKGQ